MRHQETNDPGIPDHKAAQRSRIILVLLIAAVTAGIPSCRDRETLSPQEQLAATLRKGASLRGYPWPDPYICMLNLGEAIEKAQNLAMTPQQAWERVASYILSLPEQKRLPCSRTINPTSSPLPCYIWGDYYYFHAPPPKRRKMTHGNLRGYFVDTCSGAVIQYPGFSADGSLRQRTYRHHLSYGATESRILTEPHHPESLYTLGACYAAGRGVPESAEKAARAWARAAAQGHPGAQRQLGLCYRQGLGVRQNQTLARNWLQQAAAQGDEKAAQELRKLRDTPTAPDTRQPRPSPQRP